MKIKHIIALCSFILLLNIAKGMASGITHNPHENRSINTLLNLTQSFITLKKNKNIGFFKSFIENTATIDSVFNGTMLVESIIAKECCFLLGERIVWHLNEQKIIRPDSDTFYQLNENYRTFQKKTFFHVYNIECYGNTAEEQYDIYCQDYQPKKYHRYILVLEDSFKKNIAHKLKNICFPIGLFKGLSLVISNTSLHNTMLYSAYYGYLALNAAKKIKMFTDTIHAVDEAMHEKPALNNQLINAEAACFVYDSYVPSFTNKTPLSVEIFDSATFLIPLIAHNTQPVKNFIAQKIDKSGAFLKRVQSNPLLNSYLFHIRGKTINKITNMQFYIFEFMHLAKEIIPLLLTKQLGEEIITQYNTNHMRLTLNDAINYRNQNITNFQQLNGITQKEIDFFNTTLQEKQAKYHTPLIKKRIYKIVTHKDNTKHLNPTIVFTENKNSDIIKIFCSYFKENGKEEAQRVLLGENTTDVVFLLKNILKNKNYKDPLAVIINIFSRVTKNFIREHYKENKNIKNSLKFINTIAAIAEYFKNIRNYKIALQKSIECGFFIYR